MRAATLYPNGPALGAISLGGATFGREIDADAAFSIMDHAFARGISLFDTAATYSDGASERIIGRWLHARRPPAEALSVSTKIYPPFTPDAIDLAVAASAARLGVETIDVLQLHRWDASAATSSALIALARLVSSGRVRALGVSNFTASQLRSTLALQKQLGVPPFRVLQNNHNVAVRDIDEPLRDLCSVHDIAILTYSPLGAGFLTGKHQGGVQPGSRFALSPAHQDLYFHPVAARRLARLEQISARTHYPMPHLALAWALHQPGITSVLVGARSVAHLDQAYAAATLDAPELLAELDSA